MDEGLLCTGAQHVGSGLSRATPGGPSVWEGRMVRTLCRSVMRWGRAGCGELWVPTRSGPGGGERQGGTPSAPSPSPGPHTPLGD